MERGYAGGGPLSDGNRSAPRGPGKGAGATGIADDPALGADFGTIARAYLAPKDEDKIKRFAEHFGVPTNYFGTINGEIVRWVPERNLIAKVVPTMGAQTGVGDTLSAFGSQYASGMGPSAPQVAGGIAGAATAGSGPVSIGAATVAAGLTDWARQALDKVIAGEDAVPFAGADYDFLNMAGHGALAAGGQAMALGVNRLLQGGAPLGVSEADRARIVSQVEKQKWAALEAEAEARGVKLSAGQKTGLASLMQKERQLSRYSETADTMQEFKQGQWQTQIPRAYRDEMANIGPFTGREDMISSFREGADAVVNEALRVRSEEAKGVYKLAYDTFPSLDSPALRNIWDRAERAGAVKTAREISDLRGELMGPVDAELSSYAKEAAALGKMDAPKGGVASGLSLKTWDQVKRGLDEIIGQNANPSTGKLTAKGQAAYALKTELVSELDRLTGGKGGSYAMARMIYGDASDMVDSVLNGGIGFIQKMSGPDRVGMVTRVFNGKNILPEEITRMREAFTSAGEEGAWNSGVVAHLANVMDDSIKSAGMSGNVPGQMYSRLGRDPLQHDAIVAAIGPQKADSFERFLNVLNAASRSLPEGSPTATDLGARAGGVSTKMKVAGKLASPDTYWNAGNNVVSLIENLREPGSRAKLAEYLLTDKGIKQVQAFKPLSRLTQGAVVALSNIAVEAGVIGSGARKPSDRPIEVLQQNPSQPQP